MDAGSQARHRLLQAALDRLRARRPAPKPDAACGGAVTQLAAHPNKDEICGVLAQLCGVGDLELTRLAAAWQNTPAVACARARALRPDSPLILDVLTAFEAVTDLFAVDLAGEAAFLTVDRSVAAVAVKAIRDAVAATFARPVLGASEYAALLAPWRSVFPAPTAADPDLGPHGERINVLLQALPMLAGRCHDPRSAELFDQLHDWSFTQESERREAVEAAFQAAVLTGRRRLWTMLRRTAVQTLESPRCRCRMTADESTTRRAQERVRQLMLGSLVALLVADVLDDSHLQLLSAPGELLCPSAAR